VQGSGGQAGASRRGPGVGGGKLRLAACWLLRCRALHDVAVECNDAEMCQFIEEYLLHEQVGGRRAGGPASLAGVGAFLAPSVCAQLHLSLAQRSPSCCQLCRVHSLALGCTPSLVHAP